jgi:hypothetical protein
MVSGPTGCGKSYFVRELIKNQARVIDTKFKEIIWCYGEWQAMYDELREEVTFNKGILKDLPTDGEPRLIVIDDLMREADGNVVDLFTKGSHHRNLSVLFLTQNLFHKGKAQRDISLNAHYMIVFKNPRDAGQIIFLARQISPENPKFILEAYRDATAVPHGYLLLDLKQSTDDIIRVRTNVFDEHVTIYVPKRIKEK